VYLTLQTMRNSNAALEIKCQCQKTLAFNFADFLF
jgi:hypothetical protein